jgi:hypothetical protein
LIQSAQAVVVVEVLLDVIHDSSKEVKMQSTNPSKSKVR